MSPTIAAIDVLADVPECHWLELMAARREFAETVLPYDCRCLLQFCNEADDMFAVLGFESPEAMIRDGLGLAAPGLKLVVEWLRLNPQSEAVPLEKARSAALLAHGGDRRSEEFHQLRNTNLKPGTDNRDYVLARLCRDGRNDLADRVRTGEIAAHAAAIEAGYRRQKSKFDLTMKWIPQFSKEERERLRQALATVSSKET